MNLTSFSDSTTLHTSPSYHHGHYLLLAVCKKYSIWNAAVAALQFWTANLKPHILSDAKE